MQIPYMIIGGIANSIYGNPRQTFDIDIKVNMDSVMDVSAFISEIQELATLRTINPVEFVKETNVLPVEVDQVKVDIVFAGIDYEFQAIKNAQILKFAGIKLKVCAVEDLIIQKSISHRQKDWFDIETLININRDTMDWNYLLENVKMLAEILDDSNIYDRIKAKQK